MLTEADNEIIEDFDFNKTTMKNQVTDSQQLPQYEGPQQCKKAHNNVI